MGTKVGPLNREPSTRILRLALLGAAFGILCILFLLMFSWFQPDQYSLSDRYFPSATPTRTSTPTQTPTNTSTPTITRTATVTNTPRPTFTPTPNASTQEALQAALQATLDYSSSEWQVAFSENFDNNQNQWPISVQEDENAKISHEIVEGKYLWQVKTNNQFITSVDLANISCRNFYFRMEARQVTGTINADYGLIFRKDSNGNYYYFAMNQMIRYSLRRFYNGEWSDLIPWTISPAVQIRESNRLEVFAEDDHFILFINKQLVGEAHDDLIQEGTCALAVGLPLFGSQAVFEFDNVEVRTPK